MHMKTSPDLTSLATWLPAAVWLLVLAAWPLAAAADRAAEQAADALPVPDSITVQGIPPVPSAIAATVLPYENTRAANLQDWHPTERRLLVTTRFAQASQLHEVGMPMGARTQLTFFDERVFDGRYRPGVPRQIAFSIDRGGAEFYQIHLLDRGTGRIERLTDGSSRNVDPVWSRDGEFLAWTGTARNGTDYDLYVVDPDEPGSARRVAELSGQWSPLDWSPDRRRLLLLEDVSAEESYLHVVDLATGEVTALTPRTGRTVSFEGGRWSPDGTAVYTATDRDGEFLRLVRLDLATGRGTPLSADLSWDVESFDLSDDGALVAFVSNEDGVSRLHVRETATGRALPVPELPAGEIGSVRFRPGSREVAFAVSWARSPSDVYSWDPASSRLDRWTASEVGGLDPERFVVPELVRYSTFDGAGDAPRTIPAFVYRPAADRFPGKRPVLIDIHGGPESQSRPRFRGSMNYLLDELGVALVYPNVRGSSGYGKSSLGLDDGARREDSVKDIGALLDWIAAQPGLDPERVMVSGGSYGGYMVLAALIHYGDRLRCGHDAFGISNFVSFLQNTQAYRRDRRRAEYGDERDPEMRTLLERISPLTRADRIRDPLLVVQGANDPRVPLSESDQIVARVRANGVPVWYLVAADEGHGFSKKSNSDYMRVVVFEFVKSCLVAPRSRARR